MGFLKVPFGAIAMNYASVVSTHRQIACAQSAYDVFRVFDSCSYSVANVVLAHYIDDLHQNFGVPFPSWT